MSFLLLLGGSNTLNRVEKILCFIGWGYPYLSCAAHLDFKSLNSHWIAKRICAMKAIKVYFSMHSVYLQILLRNVVKCHFLVFFKAIKVCSLYFLLNRKFEVEQTVKSQPSSLVPQPFSLDFERLKIRQ